MARARLYGAGGLPRGFHEMKKMMTPIHRMEQKSPNVYRRSFFHNCDLT